MKKRYFSFSIQFTLFSIFLLATCITASVAIVLQYYFSTEQASRSAYSQFQMSAKYTRDHLAAIDHHATELTELLASDTRHQADHLISDAQLKVFAKAMQNNPIYYSIFIGNRSGHFTQLINLETTADVKALLNAADSDRWIKVEVTPSDTQTVRKVSFFNENMQLRYEYSEQSEFDPTTRPWFEGANQGQVYKSAPYQFQSLQAPGLTYSQQLQKESSVIGIDIALSSLSQYLHDHQLETDTKIYLYQASGEVIATNAKVQFVNDNQFENLPVTPIPLSFNEEQLIANTPKLYVSNSADWSPIDFSISGEPKGYAIDKLNLVSDMTGIEFEYVNGFTWPELVARYKNKQLDALQAVYKTPENTNMGVLTEPFLSLPFALITKTSNDNSEPSQTSRYSHISALENKSLAIAEGWSITAQLKRSYPNTKIVVVKTIRDVFDAVKSGRVDAGIDTRLSLLNTQKQFFMDGVVVHPPLSFSPKHFPETLHLLLQPEYSALAPIINRALARITEKQTNYLADKWLSQNAAQHQAEHVFAVPNKTLLDAVKDSQLHNTLIRTDNHELLFISPVQINNRQTSYFAIVADTRAVFASSLREVRLSILLTAACLLCLLPLSYLFSTPIVKPIRKLMEQNKKIIQRKYNQVSIDQSHIKELDQLGQSLKDMSHAIELHEQRQTKLLESFIELIAQAIDDKSPYTGGHCKRVPDIGIQLADAASKSNNGIFADFSFDNEEQKREFKMAAWLHDCGKITTPEHIVDKATKLETIYNRIHEIRMRFEVLWRDALIEYHQQVQLTPESQQFFKTELDKKHKQLQDDFAFIAQCNQGGEFLSGDKRERLEALAQITWERYFDDSLGLSDIEQGLKPKVETKLPCKEPLLADKVEHQITRDNFTGYDEKFGIKMAIPELFANKGELYNLCISRGTLTAEDRFKINEHIISTIKMLDSLPFPPELQNVPRWASTHHETLIGTGYPRKLHKEDLSIPERILVIADIFEALTASDRPYKKAKTLSESLNIMKFMVKDQHIDADIFELFLTSGVYLEYAHAYLDASQIDEVDINKYLNKQAVA